MNDRGSVKKGIGQRLIGFVSDGVRKMSTGYAVHPMMSMDHKKRSP